MILKDGTRIERVICVEEHRGFETDAWIHPNNIERIEESSVRMPPKLATKLYKAGQSGMGYEIFKMKMKSGDVFVFVSATTSNLNKRPSSKPWNFFRPFFQTLENCAERGGLGEARPTQHPGDPVILSKFSHSRS